MVGPLGNRDRWSGQRQKGRAARRERLVKAGGGNSQLSVPLLFEDMFPSLFAGIGCSAVVIGALVPAAIMSIASASLFTRSIYNEFFNPDATPAQEARVGPSRRSWSACTRNGSIASR